MAEAFRFEDPGEGIHEGEILEVHVSQGDEVADGDIVLTVETDKAAVEVPAPFSGTIAEIRVSQGDTVEVGDVLMTYETGDGAAKPDEEAETEEKGGNGEARGKETEDEAAEDEEASEEAKGDESGREEGSGQEDAPKARLARDRGEAPYEGAHDSGDAREDAGDERAKEKSGSGAARGGRTAARDGPVPAAPATRRLARELGVALDEVEGSGPEGRVTPDDVRGAADGGEEAAGSRAGKRRAGGRREAGTAPLPDFAQWGEVERRPLRSIRRATARRMARSWADIPHVTHMDKADITALERFRREHEAAVEEAGGKLTLTVLAMKALVAALKEHPRFNASLDAESEEIVLKRYYNIGVAIDTEAGLYVPVVRDADRKSLIELSAELVALARKARAGELAPEEMRGGTFTITNPGPLGGRSFTPLINHPEAAILGLAQARLEPVVEGDIDDYGVTARLMLPICMAFDHRINDGADAARFARTLVDTLTDPEAMVLHL